MTLKHTLLPSTEHVPDYNGQPRLLPWGTDLDGPGRAAFPTGGGVRAWSQGRGRAALVG